MIRRAQITAVLVYFSLLVVGFGGLLSAYWLWWPVTPFVSFVPEPRSILNPGGVLRPGDYILFEAHGEHFTDGVGVSVTAQLENSFLLGMPTVEFTTTRGEFGPIINSRYQIPEFAPPGRYRLVIKNVYHLNPLRDWVYVVETVPFEVVAKE